MKAAIFDALCRLSALMAVGFCAPVLAQGRAPFPIHQEQAAGELEKAPTPRQLRVFRGYGRYKMRFVELCEFLRSDGRADKVYEMLYPASERDAECIACRPLLRPFALSCKSKITRSRAKEGSSGTEPKQREPHAQVIAATGGLFADLAAEEDILAETAQAVKKLLGLLREPENKTKGERDYFLFLARVMEAPFKKALKTRADQVHDAGGAGDSSPPPQVVLDELF